MYVIVLEFISLGRFIPHWSQYDQPFSYIDVDITCLLCALLVVVAVVCVWFDNRKLKLISSAFLFTFSLFLISISFVSAWFGSFMNGYMGDHAAFQDSSIAVVLAFLLAGMLLSILSFIKYYREKGTA